MRILIATGGSVHSMVALTFGTHLAQVTKASLKVLTVVKREEEREHARTILERARLVLDPAHADFDTQVRVGHPAEEIIAEAEAGRYSMVVVGEKQHHSLASRFLLGSTALRVVEHAPIPTVIVKGEVGPVTRILLCDSGVETQPLVDRLTSQLPEMLRGTKSITILHVLSQIGAMPNVKSAQLQANPEALIEEHTPEGEMFEHDMALLKPVGSQVKPKIRRGKVVDEILAEAREGDYDLVVIGANRGTGWRRILLDDLAHQIIVELDRPVLIVR